MRIIVRIVVIMQFAVLAVTSSICAAENTKLNPHSDTGDCSICHVAPEAKLRGWFVFGSTKRELRDNPNQICLQCHTIEPVPGEESLAVGIGHATGKKPAVNHGNLPLASDGTITCATTCHNMHVASDNSQLQRKHLRLPANSLCISCHDR